MLLIFTYLTFAIVAGIIAGARGRSGFGYFLLSLIVSPLIGIILAAALPNLKPSIEREAEMADTRACPICAERIKNAARVCRFCGCDVEPIAVVRASAMADIRGAAEAAIVIVVVIAAIFFVVHLTGVPGPQETRMDAVPAAAPAAAQAAPVPATPIPAPASPRPQPKESAPKAPAPPLRITPQ